MDQPRDGIVVADGRRDLATTMPPPICSAGGWCWSNPSPQGNSLFGVWANSADDIVAVGEGGTALHLRDGAWTLEPTPSAVHLHGVWGASTSAIYAAGENGTLLRFDGQRWTTMASPTSEILKGLWGRSASEVYAVGHNGTLLAYDGQSWSLTTSGTSANLTAVWGDASGLVVTGTGGTLRRQNQGAWSSVDCQTGYTLQSVWGTSLSDLWVASVEGVVHRVRGADCALEYRADGAFLASITGSGSNDITVGGIYGRYHYDGTSWSKTSEHAMNSVASLSAGHALAVGRDGLLVSWKGGSWQGDAQHLSASLFAATAAGDDLYVAHWGGAFHLHGETWDPQPVWKNLVALAAWGQSATEVYFAGRGLAPLLFDGSRLEQLPTPAPTVLLSTWGDGRDRVFFGDANGTVHRYAGTEWSMLPTGASAPIAGLWGTARGELYAATMEGEIRHYNGSSWRLATSTGGIALASIWADDTDRVIAVGEQGVVLERKADVWGQTTLGGGDALTSVVGRGAEAFAAGEAGVIFRSDGTTWQSMESGTKRAFRSACLGANGRVYVVGSGGAVLYHD